MITITPAKRQGVSNKETLNESFEPVDRAL